MNWPNNPGPRRDLRAGHSMGNRGTTLALAQLFQRAARAATASATSRWPLTSTPEVFKGHRPCPRPPGRPDHPCTPPSDKGLQASGWCTAVPPGPGRDPSPSCRGIESIDASQVSTDLLGHSYYAEGSVGGVRPGRGGQRGPCGQPLPGWRPSPARSAAISGFRLPPPANAPGHRAVHPAFLHRPRWLGLRAEPPS